MNPSCTADGTCVRFEEVVIEYVAILVKLLPQYVIRNNTFGIHFFCSSILEGIKYTFQLDFGFLVIYLAEEV